MCFAANGINGKTAPPDFIPAGRLPACERIGNAYRLELTGKKALTEDLVDENSPAQEITLAVLSKALEAWIEAFE